MLQYILELRFNITKIYKLSHLFPWTILLIWHYTNKSSFFFLFFGQRIYIPFLTKLKFGHSPLFQLKKLFSQLIEVWKEKSPLTKGILSLARALVEWTQNIQCGEGDGAGIPELVGDGDEVQFLISVEYG